MGSSCRNGLIASVDGRLVVVVVLLVVFGVVVVLVELVVLLVLVLALLSTLVCWSVLQRTYYTFKLWYYTSSHIFFNCKIERLANLTDVKRWWNHNKTISWFNLGHFVWIVDIFTSGFCIEWYYYPMEFQMYFQFVLYDYNVVCIFKVNKAFIFPNYEIRSYSSSAMQYILSTSYVGYYYYIYSVFYS